MAASNSALIVPGNGTLFYAAKTAALPAEPLTAFSLTGTPPTGWTNLGHTSKENTAAFSREGGETTALNTWLQDNVRTVYSATSWGLTIPALQFDGDTLDLAFNGDFDPTTGGYIVPGQSAPIETQLFMLMQDNSGKLAFWMPETTVTLGEAPSVTPEAFMELPLSAAINSAPEDVMPAVDGRPGIMQIFKTGLTAPTTP
ncbi:hypothetical protein MUN77_01635 [Leucobacter allii]|uniref:phage tail tube protein n=1 Tax=Leucobacter allii TaxID=2932247 RepID=UPI001FD5291E|nr:hypothetical protein [Leucobacter allii]UOR02061.1 hypothetical protein MUN77_01635 [Leucobacter allii]